MLTKLPSLALTGVAVFLLSSLKMSVSDMRIPSLSYRFAQKLMHQYQLLPRLHAACSARHRCAHRKVDGKSQFERPARRRCGLVVPRSSSESVASSLQKTAALDKLIELMLSARSPEELGKIVAENLLAFDQKFWLRLATRSDTASSAEEKKRLQDLAGVTMRMVDALVKTSDIQLTDSAAALQKILVAAADENGEWQVPLPEARIEAMRKEMNSHTIDESLLANAFAWMRKAKEDRLDGTVALLQQVLQLYSARQLVSPTPPELPEDQVLEKVLGSKEAEWLPQIEEASAAGKISQSSFLTAIRRKMESVVLALPSGSYAQRVQAEYLKELENRAEAFFKR